MWFFLSSAVVPDRGSSRGDMLRSRALVLFVVVIWLAFSLPDAQAGPPFFTDDPVPLDLHHWEFYLASQDFVARGLTSGTLPHIETNYGLTREMMIHVIVPLAYSRPRGATMQYGLGDVELGLKYRFVQETNSRPQIGTFPHVEVPLGSPTRGLGNAYVQVFLPLWIQKSWGPWTSYGGGGYWTNPGPGNKDFWMFGWTVTRDFSKTLTAGVELIRNTPDSAGSRGETAFNLGALVTIGDGKIIMFSAGRDIRGDNRFFTYVALYWTWGPK
jgi:hypothetical protein